MGAVIGFTFGRQAQKKAARGNRAGQKEKGAKA